MFSKLKKIILATDGSPYSEGAIREAISLAKKCSGRLYAVFVLETNPEYETIGSSFFEKEEAEAIGHLASIKARSTEAGVNCETIFHHGEDAYQYFVNESVKRNSDMIVIGRRGFKGLAKLLIGETAAKVIGKAACNVLVVPKAAKIKCRNILVAANGSDHSSAAISEAIGIAKCYGSNIVAVSVTRTLNGIEKARINLDKIIELAHEEGLSAEAVTPVGKPCEAILEMAGGRGVDLIVMGAYGREGIKKLLIGSTTEKIIGSAGCGVLVVKNNKAAGY